MSSFRIVMRSSRLIVALVRHLEGKHEDGNLDHARAVEDLAVANTGGFIRREVLDPDAGLARELARGTGQQVVKRRGLLGQQQARKREGEEGFHASIM